MGESSSKTMDKIGRRSAKYNRMVQGCRKMTEEGRRRVLNVEYVANEQTIAVARAAEKSAWRAWVAVERGPGAIMKRRERAFDRCEDIQVRRWQGEGGVGSPEEVEIVTGSRERQLARSRQVVVK